MANLLRVILFLPFFSFVDHGTFGHTFPIHEEDIVVYIKKRLSAFEGEEQLEAKLRSQCETSFQESQVHIRESKVYTAHYFDPTIVSKSTIRDIEGNIIILKGSHYNPLDDYTLSQDLLFFDGENKAHISWAKTFGNGVKWILVKGRPLILEEREEFPVYYDQFGLLTSKLGIEEIPCKVSQEGLKLKVEFIPIQEEG